MKHILHLVRHDARALRVPLALWIVVLLAEALQFCLGPTTTPAGTGLWRFMSGSWLGILKVAASVIVTALLVQIDPTVGTSAHWKARPIGRLTLLASKALSGVLWFVALPCVTTFIMLVSLGLGVQDAVFGVWSMVALQVGVLIASFAAAAITGSLLHFAMALLGVLGVLALTGGVVGPWLRLTWPALHTAVAPGTWNVLGAALAVVVAGIVCQQYLTLRTRRTVALLGGCVVVFGLVTTIVDIRPSRSLRQQAPAVPETLVRPSALSTTVDISTQQVEATSVLDKTQGRNVSFQYAFVGVGPGIEMFPDRIDSEIEFPDGTRHTWTSDFPSPRIRNAVGPPAPDQYPYRGTIAALGNVQLALPLKPSWSSSRVVAIRIPEDKFRAFEGRTVHVTSNVVWRVHQFRVGSTTPLKKGGTLRFRGGAMVIERLATDPLRVVIDMRRTFVTTAWPNNVWYRYMVLRNPVRRQAVMTDSGIYGGVGMAFGFTAASFYRDGRREMFEYHSIAPAPFVVDDAWLADAELVRFDDETVGYITHPLKIDDFVLGAVTK